MKTRARFTPTISGAVLLLAAVPAFAVDTVSQDAMADRMMQECMKKRDHAIPEQQALQACKRHVNQQLKNARKEELSKGPATTEPGPRR